MERASLPLPPALAGWPLLGNAVAFMKDPIAFLANGMAEKGRIFSFRLAHKAAVAVIGPEYNRFFFEETDKLLSLQEAYPFFHKMFHPRLYCFADAHDYQEQRSILLPCFHGKKMVNYIGVMAREATAFMERLGPAGEFELSSTLGPLVMNVAAAAFLGDDFRNRLPEDFFEVYRDFSGGMEPVLPLWLPLPRLLRSKKAKARMHAMLGALIAARRDKPREPEDFLQSLVAAQYSDGTPVPDILIINLIMFLLFAGHETTTGHISWGLVDLLQHPDYLRTVLAEQDAVLGPRDELDLERVHRLKRLEWLIKETERLRPPAYLLTRKATSDFELGGFRVKKGTMVFNSAAVSHRLPEVFTAPNRFDPERFAPARAEDKQPFSLVGFGGGIHRCTGVNFAYQEMKVILTLLFRRYELELVDPDPQPNRGVANKWPASPCRVRYRLRPQRTVPAPAPTDSASA